MKHDQVSIKKINETEATNFPIVAIGASAGGLEALQEIFKQLPSDTGMAFVVIQHLDPKHDSALNIILARGTKMTVSEVENGMPIEPNHVYIIPPNKDLSLSGRTLRLSPRTLNHGLHLPINHFFTDLAKMKQGNAIGVILSGSGSDGSLGLQAIKAEEGITLVQEEKSAKYEQMPSNAIATECVDFILPPTEIAQELVRISKHPYLRTAPDAPDTPDEEGTVSELSAAEAIHFNAILKLLHKRSKVDFSHYKSNTIRRRVLKRMVLHKVDSLETYRHMLEEKTSELDALYNDVLINVTDFFRDAEVFEALKTVVFPEITKDKKEEPIRIWVPGCSTGEEPYSIAMAFLEFLGESSPTPSIQIFATDLSEKVIEKARRGIYPKSRLQNISEERVRRFFHQQNGNFQISKQIRDLCVFATQNVTGDPPFSKVDLVSCRNILIYLGPVLQKKVIQIFNYALNQPGFLLLGVSEAIGAFSDFFTQIDKKNKIYLKKTLRARPFFDFSWGGSVGDKPKGEGEGKGAAIADDVDIKQQAERLILGESSAVIVDQDLEIVHIIGDTGPYLSLSEGKPALNLIKMARESLGLDLRTAVQFALKEKLRVKREGIRLIQNGNSKDICIEVIPLRTVQAEGQNLLVVFKETAGKLEVTAPQFKAVQKASKRPLERVEAENIQLAHELKSATESLQSLKENLQTALEAQEAANEELRSANEEVLSSNEELQSTNEELETAKEELQSTNEELITVNEELQHRNADLTLANNDLLNLLNSIKIPVIMLGADLRIRRFTPLAEKLFNLIATDVGRPISDITPNFTVPDLKAKILDVIDTVSTQEIEVRDFNNYAYSLRIHPYKTLDNRIDGVLLVLVDIHGIQLARDTARSIVETVREPLLVLDKNLRVLSANDSFYRNFQVTKKETENQLLSELGDRQWKLPKLLALLEEIVPKNTYFENYEMEHSFEKIGRRVMLLNARKILCESTGMEDMILLAIEDVTERKEVEARLQKTLEDLARSNTELEKFASVASHDLTAPVRSISTYCQLLSERYGEKLDQEGRNYLQSATVAAGRMMNLIHELLDYARVGQSTKPLELINVRQALDVALINLKAAIDESEAKITCDPLPEIMFDQIQFIQLLQNLIGNAIKFPKPGEHPQIHISAKKGEREWVFSVRDQGIGIDPQDSERIFKMFERLHTYEEQGGAGIGLAICKKIVEFHGGKIWVESKPGEGSTFFFTSPLSVGSRPAA